MSDLLKKSPVARDWADSTIRGHLGGAFGKLVPAVIWSDKKDSDGEPLVPIDPADLVGSVNRIPHILLHNHDPGRPKGQVLEAAYFETEGGEKFVAAVLGYYAGGDVLDFRGLDLDTQASVSPPARLPVLPEGNWIQFATDPNEVDGVWLDEVTKDAPIRVERTKLSHNAADSTQELIRVGLVYLAVLCDPFVTSIASEAGRDTYAAIHMWVRKLLKRLANRRDPILDIHTHQDGCQVSFLFRGREVKHHYAAHDALPGAAAQAAQLIAKLKARGMPARQLIYEFDEEALSWFPSYAVLKDNRIVTDNGALIAIEQLPTSLAVALAGMSSSLRW